MYMHVMVWYFNKCEWRWSTSRVPYTEGYDDGTLPWGGDWQTRCYSMSCRLSVNIHQLSTHLYTTDFMFSFYLPPKSSVCSSEQNKRALWCTCVFSLHFEFYFWVRHKPIKNCCIFTRTWQTPNKQRIEQWASCLTKLVYTWSPVCFHMDSTLVDFKTC